jgi:plastocyanin
MRFSRQSRKSHYFLDGGNVKFPKLAFGLILALGLAACNSGPAPTSAPLPTQGGYPAWWATGILPTGYPAPLDATGYPAPPATPTPSTDATVTYKDFEIAPAHLTIAAGTTVMFLVESDSGAHYKPYNAEAPNLFEAPDMTSGSTWSFTFAEPGTVVIRCRYHDQMIATITVTP